MQAAHISLGDFYMQWLIATSEIKKMRTNPFSTPLVLSLTNRLDNLRTSMAFKTALYIDPRFNYLSSKLFDSDEKAQIQVLQIENITNFWS